MKWRDVSEDDKALGLQIFGMVLVFVICMRIVGCFANVDQYEGLKKRMDHVERECFMPHVPLP